MPACPFRRARSRLGLVRVAAVAVLAAGTASACGGPLVAPTPIAAAGAVERQERPLPAFTSVAVDGPLNLVLAAGSGQAVRIEAPADALPLVRTEVSGAELLVSLAQPDFVSSRTATIRIFSSRLTAVALSGAATATLEVMAPTFSVSASGGSVAKAIGRVTRLAVAVLGGAEAQLGDVSAETATISAAGGGRATLRVARQLTGTADGGSVITLVTAPVARSVSVTGGARIVGP